MDVWAVVAKGLIEVDTIGKTRRAAIVKHLGCSRRLSLLTDQEVDAEWAEYCRDWPERKLSVEKIDIFGGIPVPKHKWIKSAEDARWLRRNLEASKFRTELGQYALQEAEEALRRYDNPVLPLDGLRKCYDFLITRDEAFAEKIRLECLPYGVDLAKPK